MNAIERSTAWAVDQLDPDSWLIIPDFGINPGDVAFEGFALPIVTPNSKNYELRCVVREHVKTARTLMRKEGRCFSEVSADFKEAMKALDPPGFEDLEFEDPELEIEYEKSDVSRSQARAIFYVIFMENAGIVVHHLCDRNLRSLKFCYELVAKCAEGIRELMLLGFNDEKPFLGVAINEAIANYVNSQRRALSEAGSLGAKAKHLTTTELKRWALEKAKGMRGSDRDIARKLSAALPTNLADASKDPIRLIYDALRKRKKLN